MTSKRNPGPVLALTGAGIAVAAVIAGFVFVGGPGDARDKRIDHRRLSSVAQAADVATCAFIVTKQPPASLEAALTALSQRTEPFDKESCNQLVHAGVGDVKGVEYRKLDERRIELCQTFLRAEESPPRINDPGYADVIYPDGPFGLKELDKPRPVAGRFCYEIDLVKNADFATNTNSHAGHMDVFE